MDGEFGLGFAQSEEVAHPLYFQSQGTLLPRRVAKPSRSHWSMKGGILRF